MTFKKEFKFLKKNDNIEFYINNEKLDKEKIRLLVPDILKALDIVDSEEICKEDIFNELIKSIQGTDMIQKYFDDLIKTFDKLEDEEIICYAWIDLFKENNLIKDKMLDYLPLFDKINWSYFKYEAFKYLIDEIKGTKLMDNNFTIIKQKFLNVLNSFKGDSEDNSWIFIQLIGVVKKTNLFKMSFIEILNAIDEIENKSAMVKVFRDLIEETKVTRLINQYYAEIEEKLYSILNAFKEINEESIFLHDDTYKDKADFFKGGIIEPIRETELLNRNYSFIKNMFPEFSYKIEFNNIFDAIDNFIEKSRGPESINNIQELLLEVLNGIQNIYTIDEKFNAFCTLINKIQNPELIISNSALFEEKLLNIINAIEKLNDDWSESLGYSYKSEFFSILDATIKKVNKKWHYLIEERILNSLKTLPEDNLVYFLVDVLKDKLELDDSLLNKIIEIYINHDKIDPVLDLYYQQEESIKYSGIIRFHNLLPSELQKEVIDIIKDSIREEEPNWAFCEDLFSESSTDVRLLTVLTSNILKVLSSLSDIDDLRKNFQYFLHSFDNAEYTFHQQSTGNFFYTFASHEKYLTFKYLIDKIKKTVLIKEKFPELLNMIKKLPGSPEYDYKYAALAILMNAIKGTRIINKFYSLIAPCFTEILKEVEELEYILSGDRYESILCDLINSIKDTKLLEVRFPEYWEKLEFLNNEEKS